MSEFLKLVWSTYVDEAGKVWFVRIRRSTAVLGEFPIMSDADYHAFTRDGTGSVWPYQHSAMRKVRIKFLDTEKQYINVPQRTPQAYLYNHVASVLDLQITKLDGTTGLVLCQVVSRTGERVVTGGFIFPPEFGMG